MGKHLKFYEECMKAGVLPHCGLCHCAAIGLIDHETLERFEPTYEDVKEAGNNMDSVYWASDMDYDKHDFLRMRSFTELRQTIVLFMAAIKGEL